jgi:hypothetical protein
MTQHISQLRFWCAPVSLKYSYALPTGKVATWLLSPARRHGATTPRHCICKKSEWREILRKLFSIQRTVMIFPNSFFSILVKRVGEFNFIPFDCCVCHGKLLKIESHFSNWSAQFPLTSIHIHMTRESTVSLRTVLSILSRVDWLQTVFGSVIGFIRLLNNLRLHFISQYLTHRLVSALHCAAGYWLPSSQGGDHLTPTSCFYNRHLRALS